MSQCTKRSSSSGQSVISASGTTREPSGADNQPVGLPGPAGVLDPAHRGWIDPQNDFRLSPAGQLQPVKLPGFFGQPAGGESAAGPGIDTPGFIQADVRFTQLDFLRGGQQAPATLPQFGELALRLSRSKQDPAESRNIKVSHC
ncbi:MAG TPA: hypothetical protein VJ417_10840 [Candidatus Glassbacteria bacterium]|nr:hypothetical protein [Candidatus Glassbacteria bacterium]